MHVQDGAPASFTVGVHAPGAASMQHLAALRDRTSAHGTELKRALELNAHLEAQLAALQAANTRLTS